MSKARDLATLAGSATALATDSEVTAASCCNTNTRFNPDSTNDNGSITNANNI
jgi:hypothetical protein